MIIPGRFMSIVYHDRDRHGFPLVARAERPGQQEREARRQRQRERVPSSNTNASEGIETQPSWMSRLGARIPGRSGPARTQQQLQSQSAAPEVQPTPSQLEAGR